MKITITYTNDEDEEVSVELPAKMEVCWDCDGEGYVLTPGMRGHAYSTEEFEESFPEYEDKQDYFRRGGIYDVACETCKGKNVIPEVDDSHLTKEQKKHYGLYLEEKEIEAYWDKVHEEERKMGA